MVITNDLPDSGMRLITGDVSRRLRRSTVVASHTSVGFMTLSEGKRRCNAYEAMEAEIWYSEVNYDVDFDYGIKIFN